MFVLWRVIVKEFLQLRQDCKMLPMIFVAPVIQLVIFGFAVNTDVNRVPMVLVDRDRTAASRELVDRFVGGGTFELVGTESEPAAIEDWMVSGRAHLALVIDAGYHELGSRGRPARVQALVDGADANTTTVALGYASSILARKNREVLAAGLTGPSTVAGGPAFRVPGRIVSVPRVWYNPDLKSRWFFVPAVLAMILMLMTLLLSSMGVVREKELGTLEQLIVTPIRAWQLIAGKLFPFAAIGVFQVFLVTGVAVFGFGVPLRGSFWLLLGLTFLFILNMLGLGLLVSTVVANQQQAMMLAAFCVMVPMIYLSGLIFPIENMPRAIQTLTYAIPLRYYAVILRGIFLKGVGLDVLWPQAVTLAAMGAGLLTLAAVRFRKRLD